MKYELTARRIRTLMNNMNMTAQELSEKTGVGKSSISHYVNGTHCPGNLTADKLAKVLRCKPEYLMGFGADIEIDSEKLSDETVDFLKKYEKADDITKQMIERLLK